MKNTNETYEIEVGSPLLRPGLTVRTKVSKRYLLQALADTLDNVRKFNDAENAKQQAAAPAENK